LNDIFFSEIGTCKKNGNLMFTQVSMQCQFACATSILGERKWDLICDIWVLLASYHPCMASSVRIIYPMGDIGVRDQCGLLWRNPKLLDRLKFEHEMKIMEEQGVEAHSLACNTLWVEGLHQTHFNWPIWQAWEEKCNNTFVILLVFKTHYYFNMGTGDYPQEEWTKFG
jgi:hypothetical protein